MSVVSNFDVFYEGVPQRLRLSTLFEAGADLGDLAHTDGQELNNGRLAMLAFSGLYQ